MTDKVRRSWLLVPLSDEERVGQAGRSGADVIVLDLQELVPEEKKPAARERAGSALATARAGGAEVFVQVDPEVLYADLRACVWPGLSGVVVARLESPQQVAEADLLLGRLEEERGILPNTLRIVASLETAKGNQQAYPISAASRRVWGLTLGRADLVMDLRPEPSGEIHLMPYLMQRLITVANAAGTVPLGAWWRAPDRGLLATPDHTYQAALRGRAIGFKGAMCLLESQVGPLNRGFTPSDGEVAAAHQLLEAYRAGEAQGAAAIRQGDRIIDRGAAVQAQRLINLAAAGAAQDRELAAPPEARPQPTP